MDDLDAGIKDIRLDRPPTAISSESKPIKPPSVNDISQTYKDGLNNDNDEECINTSKVVTCSTEFNPPSSSETIEEGRSSNEENEPHELNSNLVTLNNENRSQLGNENGNTNLVTSDKRTTFINHTLRTRHGYKGPLKPCLKPPSSGDSNKTAKSKHVFFSEGSDIVSELIEPVDPWRDVRTPSKAEVISFYRNSCQKLRCKPLERLIKQIQDASDLSCRAGTLSLRGCRLDSRSCEALESVFRRIQFENLDIENCSLEEEGATSLLEMIEFYHSTCKLNIACNPKIGMRGWQALCRMLRKTSCLTYLDARRTLLTDMTMPTFGRCVKADPPLKILHLESVYLSGRPLLILTTAMKYNHILEELYLGDNELSSTDGPPIGAMLTYNTSLKLLDLRNNQLKDIGLAHIGNGLCDQTTEESEDGLSSLILWNNQLTHEGMTYLCQGLVHTHSLKALNLGQNRLGDLGLQKLKAGLIKNKTLRKLGFLNTKIGSEGAVALAEVLADSLTITRIDIRENHLQVAGLMAFAMALKVNQSLVRLDLDKDIKKEPGMEAVMKTVLADIYNLCHRNKQLVRQSSTVSEDGSQLSRQSSTSSETSEMISYDDIFHPEARRHKVTPFSPVVSGKIDMDFNAEQFTFPVSNANPTITENIENFPRVRSNSDPVPNVVAPPPRRSRFSVTKILDNLGHHAAGVANRIANNVAHIDKLKRNNSKEKIDVKPSELLPLTEQNLKQTPTLDEDNKEKPSTELEENVLSTNEASNTPGTASLAQDEVQIIVHNKPCSPITLLEVNKQQEASVPFQNLSDEVLDSDNTYEKADELNVCSHQASDSHSESNTINLNSTRPSKSDDYSNRINSEDKNRDLETKNDLISNIRTSENIKGNLEPTETVVEKREDSNFSASFEIDNRLNGNNMISGILEDPKLNSDVSIEKKLKENDAVNEILVQNNFDITHNVKSLNTEVVSLDESNAITENVVSDVSSTNCSESSTEDTCESRNSGDMSSESLLTAFQEATLKVLPNDSLENIDKEFTELPNDVGDGFHSSSTVLVTHPIVLEST